MLPSVCRGRWPTLTLGSGLCARKEAALALDELKVQQMISASVAPIAREQKRQRRRVAAIEQRIDTVEGDVKSALQIGELVQRVMSDGLVRIEHKIDAKHVEVIARLDRAEGWIGRRRRIETGLLRVSQMAIVGALRRIFPFALVYVVLVVTWVMMVKAIGG